MPVSPMRLYLFLVPLACAMAHSPSSAIQALPDEVDPFEILAPREPSALVDATGQHAPSIEAARDMERELGGRWRVAIWNRFANTPNRAYGSGVDLAPGGLRHEGQVERAARQFISSHPSILRADASKLATYRITHALGKWVIQFQQMEGGYPVADAFTHLVFTDSGRLYAFGSNFYQGVSLPSGPSVVPENAVGIARAALPYDPASELTPMRADETVVLPMLQNGPDGPRMVFRLAHRTEVPTSEPYGLYATYVDAQTGEILIRENLVENAYSGTSQGDVEIPSYCAGNTPSTPFTHMNVVISGIISEVDTVVTDSAGNFSIGGSEGTRTYAAEFNGPVVNVNCTGCGGDAEASGNIDPDVPATIYFDSTAYRADERDCFYFVNKTSDFIKSIDSLWTYPKVTANVNVNQNCNANWAGTVLNFFHTGGTCHNTGEIGDVMAHEFGHCVQYSLLGAQGPNGMGEGNADIAGTFIIDAPVIGIGLRNCTNGINCPGSSCRTCENSLIYPNNVIGQEIHSAGRVICGFNWDTRQALEAKYGTEAGKTRCAQLWHFSRKMFGNPAYDQPNQVHDYFVLNDDDGDLGNGTPDYDELCQAATSHGFSCPLILLGVFITHAQLSNTSDTQNPYEVVAVITSTMSALNPDSLLVRYRLDGTGDFAALQMTPTGNQDEFHAFIPAQECGTDVDYFISAEDGLGNRKTEPTGAPAATFPFSVANILYAQTFEISSDWTQDPTHTATTGEFVRIDPIGTGFQPDSDATPPPGTFGWITAQNIAGDGVDDVDLGVSAARSAVFDLSDLPGARLSLKYFHGQRDAGGDSLGDFFRISVSNDGGNTYPADVVALGDGIYAAAWTSLDVDLESIIPLTSQMRLRVQASDGPATGDIVEGGLDDIYILWCEAPPQDTIPPTVTVLSPNGGEYLEIDSTRTITWVASDNVGVTSVDILLSTDGGSTYPTTVATIEQSVGDFAWLVPDVPTETARIKVVAHDAASLSGEDTSNSNFTIGPTLSAPPEVALTAPVGGEVIDASTTLDITWTATDDFGVTEVDIALSLDGGVTYPFLVVENEENDGVYTWSVLDSASTQARVRITVRDENLQTDSDASASDFTITVSAPPEITLISPVGNEVIDASTTFDITWNATDDVGVTGIDIHLSMDGGATYPSLVAENEVNDGVYTWSVIDSATTQARVRVTAKDANLQTVSDASASDFTIRLSAPPEVVLIAPVGSEVIDASTTLDITWTATDDFGVTEVDIALSLDGGATYPFTVAENEENDGVYTWSVLDSASTQARVRITVRDEHLQTDSDASASDFTITVSAPPEITLIAPVGGEMIDAPTTFDITWNATDDVGVTGIDIHLSMDGGATYPFLVAENEVNDGVYTWSVIDSATTQARVRVTAKDANLQTVSDASASDFTIRPSAPPEVVLTAPVGGEVIDALTTFDITWTATDDFGVTEVDIDLSLDGGATYPFLLAENEENDGAYTWSVIDSASTQARVRITVLDEHLQTDSDASASDFTITLATTGISSSAQIPGRLSLGPSVPEPFRDNAVVRFGLPRATTIDLAVYSAEGRVVRRLASGATPAGSWERLWNGKDESGGRVPSGLYFLRLSTPEGTVTRRITFLR